jgi:hypothetical protein
MESFLCMAATAIVQGCSFTGTAGRNAWHPQERRIIPMKTLVNNNNIVNFKLQTFLFAFSLLMHVATLSVAASHPHLGWLLAMLETVGWISILLTWAIALIKGIQYGGSRLWAKAWTYARTYVCIKKAKNHDLTVPVAQLKQLRDHVQRLGLALYGMTPETEQARRTHFQMLGETVPSLILPPHNAILAAEFESLVKFLNHSGFPHLERVQLAQKDFAFAQKWGGNLEARLLQAQKEFRDQQQTMLSALTLAREAHQAIGTMYPTALDHAGYQRIQGAFLVLEHLALNSRCPCPLVITCVEALQRDMQTFITTLESDCA